MSTRTPPLLKPHLVCRDAARAIDFYQQVFDAREIHRFVDTKLGGPAGHIVHAELAIGGSHVTLADEARDWGNHAPPSLGGTPVILSLEVEDARAVAARMEAAGATVVFPVEDQFYGDRQGRLADPFGHLWIITQRVKEMTDAEIQAGVDRYHDER
jgi:PhnB protein